jgi:hypothetical protein
VVKYSDIPWLRFHRDDGRLGIDHAEPKRGHTDIGACVDYDGLPARIQDSAISSIESRADRWDPAYIILPVAENLTYSRDVALSRTEVYLAYATDTNDRRIAARQPRQMAQQKARPERHNIIDVRFQSFPKVHAKFPKVVRSTQHLNWRPDLYITFAPLRP